MSADHQSLSQIPSPPPSPTRGDPLLRFQPDLLREAEILCRGLRWLEPEDAAQGAFRKAIERFGQFRGETDEQLWAWLRRILRHHVIDLIRGRNKEAPSPESDDWEERIAGSITGPSTRARRNEEIQLLRQAMERLPLHVQNALVWRDSDGLSLKEIAEKLGTTEQAVNGYLTRGRRSLRKALGEAMSPGESEP